MRMGLVQLNAVALDGTRVRANSSRHATASAATLQARLAALDQTIGRLVAEADEAEAAEARRFGDAASTRRLPRELADATKRRERLRQALASAEAGDGRRAARGESKKGPVKVPVADPDAAVMPNKEGGHAPNYTPLAAVDAASGVIVDAQVLAESNENGAMLATLARIEEAFGAKPKQVLADSNHGTGAILEGLERAGVEALIPVEGKTPTEPVMRADGSVAVAENAWSNLPRSAQTRKLDKSAFLYDKERDCYWCPMGRRLAFAHTTTEKRAGGDAEYRVYASADCAGCGLSGACLSKKAARRTVSRDQHEARREAMRGRLSTEEGKAAYGRRAPVVEGVFGVLKAVLGLRQFLMRGLADVRTEWWWACTAFNLRKLLVVWRAWTAAVGL